MFLTSPNLITATIAHAFFTRQGGMSEGIYKGLNCGLGSRDNPLHVAENLKKVEHEIGAEAGNLLTLYQIHSQQVVTVTQKWERGNSPQADAFVTREKGIALGILTADCVPILFADATHQVIGAAHAGWKGAIGGIAENTIAAMEALGAKKETIACAIGAAIAQKSYEVNGAYRENFLHVSPDNTHYFIPSIKPSHFLFDLKKYVYDRLLNAGISQINMLYNDTYAEEEHFFSFRRSTHRKEPDYGRNISVIMLKP